MCHRVVSLRKKLSSQVYKITISKPHQMLQGKPAVDKQLFQWGAVIFPDASRYGKGLVASHEALLPCLAFFLTFINVYPFLQITAPYANLSK